VGAEDPHVVLLQRQAPQPFLIRQAGGAVHFHHPLVEAHPRRAFALRPADSPRKK
jgi:hypothetical protein